MDKTIILDKPTNYDYQQDMVKALHNLGYVLVWDLDGIIGLSQLTAKFKETGDYPWLERVPAMENWLNSNPANLRKSWLRKLEGFTKS